MTELPIYRQISLRDYFVKYCYLVEGKGRIFYFCYRNINTYAEAHSFQRENAIIIFMYILTVPAIMLCEYILEQTETIMIGDFNLKSVFRLYIFVYTFWATTTLQSFSRSFNDILPFNTFERYVGTFVIIKTFFDYSGSAIRFFNIKFEPLDAFDTYQLLFSCVFSVFILLMTIIQYMVLDPEQFKDNLEYTMIVDFSKFGEEHQLCKSTCHSFCCT